MPALEPKVYGKAALVAGETWAIEAEAHVAMKLKRVFPKISQNRRGVLALLASDENCRDLEWFIERFPLSVTHPEVLEERARAYDAQVARTYEVVSGRHVPPLGGEMVKPARWYQKANAALVLGNGTLLCADVLGSGKTVSAITLLAERETLPAVVVVPAHLQLQWKAQIEKFLPFYQVHIAKKLEPYDIDFFGRMPDVLVISYAKMRGWSDELAGKFRTVVFDECQELRRRGSQKYLACAQVATAATYTMGLSHTPIYNYGDEFWPVLDCLKEGCLGSWLEFSTEWCAPGFGDKRKIEDPKAFGTFLRDAGLMVRRTRKEIGREIPPCQTIVHEIDANVAELHRLETTRELAEFIISGTGAPLERMKAAGQFDLEMRQATGLAKAPFVAEFVKLLLEAGEPVMLYGWHRAVYDVWREKFKAYKPVFYTGSESATQKEKAKEAFIAGRANPMILSLRSGSGLDGCQEVCRCIVFGELDWSAGVLEQCIGRAHRDGQAREVNAYVLACEVGSDPTMIDVLGVKEAQLHGVVDPDEDLAMPRTVDPDHIRKLAAAYLEGGR